MYKLALISLLVLVFARIEPLSAAGPFNSFFQCSLNTTPTCANTWSQMSGSGSYGLVTGASVAYDTGKFQKAGSTRFEDKLWSCDGQGKLGAFCCRNPIVNDSSRNCAKMTPGHQ